MGEIYHFEIHQINVYFQNLRHPNYHEVKDFILVC